MFIGIHHVAVVVRSVEEALGFYRDVLGLPVTQQAVVADQGVKAALLSVGGDEIELLEPTNPTGGVARFLEKKGEGIHHLCIETSDVAGALMRAKAAGLPLIDQAPRQGLAGTIGFLHPGANHGVLIELAQPGGGGNRPHHSAMNSIGAAGIEAFFVGAKDPAAMADALARNFNAKSHPSEQDPHFLAQRIVVEIGKNRVAIFNSADLAASPDVSGLLGGKVEGLFGLCLAVADFNAALRHFGERKVPLEVRQNTAATPIARVASDRTHGVSLFLRPQA
jgi:methylmalonyl-CoA/ethylmalonyl-CoA epimerase